jgi:glycine/D-amino acid oxidase-like deaminating enzyme
MSTAPDVMLHPDLKTEPYWWEAYRPESSPGHDVPKSTRVVVVGSGYAGLNTALELAKRGIDSVVLEAKELGHGASTRSGGGVAGGINLGRSFSGRHGEQDAARQKQSIDDSNDGFSHVERIIQEEKIDCYWQKTGRFVGAWTPKYYESLKQRADKLNRLSDVGASMIPRERQREEIASDFHFGGMLLDKTAALHPSLYFKGLLDACRLRNVTLCAFAPATRITRKGAGWEVETPRGTVTAEHVVIATNGYTGDVTPTLKRRMVPIASHMIATEELPADLAASLVPNRRTLSDTKRVVCYYRLSPDGRRMLFGGRPRFTPVDPRTSARILHGYMSERFPQLTPYRVTHVWTGNTGFTFDAMPHMGVEQGLHYCLGCNGSGVAMMSHLGYQTARKIAGVSDYHCSFDTEEFPTHGFYTGSPWFLPLIGGWYRFRDGLERKLAEMQRG